MIAISDNPLISKEIINKAGFMPFYYEFCSDHRAVYCDINTSVLFGAISQDTTTFSNCAFTTNYVQQCEKFKANVRKLHKKSKIFDKVNATKKKFQSDDLNVRREVIEDCKEIGEITSQLLLSAGRKISKTKYTHGKPFSGELDAIARRFRKEKN
jgi:hypothetical protein